MRRRPMQRQDLVNSDRNCSPFSQKIIVIAAVFTLPFGQIASTAQTPQVEHKSAGDVAHGKYLVEDVAMCGQCHTPHEGNENPSRTRWLQGGPVPWVPSKPESDWALTAPRIGGTPLPASDADLIKLLTTGIWTNGNRLRPPMPQFRMSRTDAEAVVEYLKSLNPQL